MLIYYIDECGDHSMLTAPGDPHMLKAGTSPHFVLAGVGVRDSSRQRLAEKLFEIKKKHFGDAATLLPWSETEIKGRHSFRVARSAASGNTLLSPKGYAKLQSVDSVLALTRDLGLVYTNFRPNIFVTVVDKREMLKRRSDLHPVTVAYTYMHQRVALAMQDLYAGDASIFVADQQTQHEAPFRAGKFKETRGVLTNKLTRKPNYDLVLDKPLWVDTALSSWDREIIQLADIAAYAVNECIKRDAVPTEEVFLWQQIKSCMASHFKTGVPSGAGLPIYPNSATLPNLGEK